MYLIKGSYLFFQITQNVWLEINVLEKKQSKVSVEIFLAQNYFFKLFHHTQQEVKVRHQ